MSFTDWSAGSAIGAVERFELGSTHPAAVVDDQTSVDACVLDALPVGSEIHTAGACLYGVHDQFPDPLVGI